jgi:hypothetical protein
MSSLIQQPPVLSMFLIPPGQMSLFGAKPFISAWDLSNSGNRLITFAYPVLKWRATTPHGLIIHLTIALLPPTDIVCSLAFFCNSPAY